MEAGVYQQLIKASILLLKDKRRGRNLNRSVFFHEPLADSLWCPPVETKFVGARVS